jgi:cation transport regulator ChaB
MSDDSKKVAQQDEPSDEVEAHKVARAAVADEGNDDEVEGHGRFDGPRNDGPRND